MEDRSFDPRSPAPCEFPFWTAEVQFREMATRTQDTVQDLRDLVARIHRSEGFAEVLAALERGRSATIDGAWGSACALTAAALARPKATLLVVLPRVSEVDGFADDLAGFLGEEPLRFAAWDSLPQELSVTDAVFGSRLRALRALDEPSPPRTIVTSIAALVQPVPSRKERDEATRTLRVGEALDPEFLLRWLVERGFERVAAIERPGEFSMHGGIVDLFPPDAVDPLRIEFFGDEVESIRRFDVETQRKLDDLESTTLTLVSPRPAAATPESEDRKSKNETRSQQPSAPAESLLASLPKNAWIVLAEMHDLVEEGRQYLARLDDARGLFGIDSVLARCTEFPTAAVAAIAADSLETTCRLRVESIERFGGPRTQVLEELASVVRQDERVLIACHNEGEVGRLAELLGEAEIPIGADVQLCVGTLERGFRLVRDRIVVLSDHELFGRSDVRRLASRRRRLETRAIDSFLDLREGDLVVHLTNGIARFKGMELLKKDNQVEEHLVLEFREGVRVYVPASLIHLVQKYVGAAKTTPTLSKLGTSGWANKKQKAAKAVTDLASDMLRLQAARAAKPGIAAPPDTHWQREFEAAFPFTETVDQVHAIADTKSDMQQPRPMDRLICGDVGYGKTEVAMRAAFKAVDAGRQVAVLVPTTVLAEQHHRTFRDRMAEYPVSVEVLSRFRSKSEQKTILEGMAAGAVDIVIGTHRLIQKDIRLHDLGLLIIDEEQRFGVEAKEMLKHLRLEVDVLTLSATPIPRTLHLSLLGIRDISNLETPPQDRQAIETRISRFDAELIRHAIVRELNRGGQVYFVHNRVYNIRAIADRLQSIVPEARIDIAHGQMREHELEDAMFRFVRGQTDVLVATTIIESGLDIPNANTIFIHQADRYGLADMHQLRGRVGRYKHRAYCYLMLEEGKPVTPKAARRLKAIEEFSELGAGFKIAMRDLEIRGAGNILGTEQSGHISAVGYELYCRLLENAVRALKNEPLRESIHVAHDLPVSAFLPPGYVPPGRQKIEVYRKLSNVGTLEELAEFRSELRDRFGPIPEVGERLIELREVQLLAWHWRIDDVHLEDKFAVFGYRDPRRIENLRRLRGSRMRIVDKRSAYWILTDSQAAEGKLLADLKSVLQPE